MLSSEHQEQVLLFQWASLNEAIYPELKNLFAVPNGGKRPQKRGSNGKMYSPTAVRLKAEGLKAGVPDVFLDVPKGNYHGLRIEMKYGKNTTTPEQKNWIERLSKYGYYVAICHSFEEAQSIILAYLKSKNREE